jgi:hypothetical protein
MTLALARTLAVVSYLSACTVRTGTDSPSPGPQPDHVAQPPEGSGEGVEEIRDDSGRVYRVSQGARGEPTVVGCADGQREAFVDAAGYPAIAGCLGAWEGTRSMRDRATGQSCGDDAGGCAVPADLCAPGWHLCGASGALADLQQVTAEQCEQAGGGRFSAAISHCETQDGCQYDSRANADYECFDRGWCSETVCCGADCGAFGSCRDGVWPGRTHIAQGTDQGCGATTSQRAGGVLCCR